MTKNVLVTGVSKGIGKEIARGLKEAGFNLFLTSKNAELLRDTAKELGVENFLTCDLADGNDLKNLGDWIKAKNIDVLINNAGEYIYGAIETMTFEKMSHILDVNLLAPTYLSSVAAVNMKSKKWGRIINIGSISGVMGESYASLYSASKAGMSGLTKALALELAEFNITVNTINPGWVETELGLKSIEDSDFSLEETLETIPQKRFVKPEEIEKLIEYLISENAKGITGQGINLCAGLSLGI